MKFHVAPVQGHTDAPYRHFHQQHFPDDVTYYTPFIRWEKDGLRKKDVKDLTSDFNDNIDLVPQIIFRDSDELKSLVDSIFDLGYKKIDLNMGCPFPLQTAKGRGAAAISNSELHKSVAEVVNENSEIRFSVKMRLGMNGADEWKSLLETLNTLDLHHITLHPRTAKEQYSGDLHLDIFAEFLKKSRNPVVFNGELKSIEDIHRISRSFPDISGVMIGRGLLSRPSLLSEFIHNQNLDREEQLQALLSLHKDIISYYRANLIGGEHQILSKIKPYWEYTEALIGRKAWKAIKKASNMAKYNTAIEII